ncbi:MAG: hypothetical protein R8G33_05680 [Gammaproteobacteria bacterium]|nr:hypothetical protein [Gammaproteobacteria bacterium]
MISEQLRTNAVAIISLIVALSGLGYNTWRNESTESNKNIREAGFFMMQELTELQEVVLYARFDRDDDRGDIKSGWSHVLAVKDISYAMPESVQKDAVALSEIWQKNSPGIALNQDDSYKQIDKAIDKVKKQIVFAINDLE